MSNFIKIGRGLVPPEHIALVEVFDVAANPRFQPRREYQARVVMLNRESLLIENTVESFAAEHGFRLVAEDNVALNPRIPFRIETFTPGEDFNPSKPFRTRLRWRDLDGNDQSKLLLTEPEVILAAIANKPSEASSERKPARAKRRQRRAAAEAPAA